VAFLEQIVASQTPAKEIHIIADNLSAHRTSFGRLNSDIDFHTGRSCHIRVRAIEDKEGQIR
jgi:hypothetical protein